MSNSLNLELPYVLGGQAQKHVTVNDSLRRIDSVVQLTVEDRSRTAPPASPQEGDRHIVAAGPTGAWTGHAFHVAAYQDGAWVFFAPREGWLAYSRAEGALVYFDGATWEIFTAVGAAETAAKFGVNGTADNTNRLVVHSDAVLFTADTTKAVPTGDARVVVNKTGSGDIASHVFQRNYAGRAELGLIGSDDFALKVTSDGDNWTEAFNVRANTARLDLASLPMVSGSEAFILSYASRAIAAAAAIPASAKEIEVRGYDAEGDGGGARYDRVGSLPADGLGFEDGAGGFWSLSGETVTARQAGAKGTGGTDDTAALRRAFTSGRNVFIETGDYYITNSLSSGAVYQRIIGDGRGKTRIKVDGAFALASLGIIRIVHHYVTVQDIQIDCDQSGASSRGTLTAYPPVIDMADRTRIRLVNLRFQEAYDGVRATGNCGGAIFDDIECGSFNVGFRFGGSLDTVELRNCRIWPYDFAGNATLLDIFSDGTTIGFRIGRVDDLKMVNCTPFRSRLIFEASDGFKPFGVVTGLALDGSTSSIDMRDGEISISSLYATTDIANDTFIHQTGGTLAISDFSFKVNAVANVPMVHVDDVAANCLIQNGRVILGSSTSAEGFRVSDGKLTVSSVRFSVDATVARTNPCIRQVNGELMAYGNTVNGRAGGSGPFIVVQSDGQHVIFGNDSNGWDIDFPNDRTFGTYGPNHNGAILAMNSVMAIGPVDSGAEGGELRLDGAGTNGNVRLDNFAGHARVFGLAAGKMFQVVSGDGTASLRGDGLSFSNGLRLDKGAADDVSSTAVGELALTSVTSGTGNTALGRRSLEAVTAGDSNVAVGLSAGRSVTGGDFHVMCGAFAGANTTGGNGFTMIGHQAGQNVSGGSGNTGIGQNAFTGVSGNLNNSTALGSGATVTGSNQVQLGDSATTTYAYGAVQNRSDERDKADVRDTVLGLEFVRRLRPVDFRWDYREDYERPAGTPADWQPPAPGERKRTRFHHGFVAQEVAAVISETGVDFGGYQDHGVAGGRDVKSLGYTELLAPLVKAVQEIAERVERLERPTAP